MARGTMAEVQTLQVDVKADFFGEEINIPVAVPVSYSFLLVAFETLLADEAEGERTWSATRLLRDHAKNLVKRGELNLGGGAVTSTEPKRRGRKPAGEGGSSTSSGGDDLDPRELAKIDLSKPPAPHRGGKNAEDRRYLSAIKRAGYGDDELKVIRANIEANPEAYVNKPFGEAEGDEEWLKAQEAQKS